MKKIVSVLLCIAMILSLFSVSVSAASKPSFGSGAPSSITLYVNDANNQYRAINISVKNFSSSYTYHVSSNNTSIATISKASVNSKSGVHFTINAKSEGSTTVNVSIKKGSTIVASKNISVKVTRVKVSVKPTNLKVASTTNNSIKLSWSCSNKNYANGYIIQVSTDSTFISSKTKQYSASMSSTSATINGLKAGTRYYIRVCTAYNFDKWYQVSPYSSSIRAITKN